MDRRLPWLLALVLLGCTPEIGDECVIATDCSSRGDRICDTAQPGGYCTLRDCVGNSCPDEAACVLFSGTVPGCSYDDRAISRAGRTFCLSWCDSDGDCRAGYQCADPKTAPWNGIVLDDNQTKKTCVVRQATLADGGVDGGDGGALASFQPIPVCMASGPEVPPIATNPGVTKPDGGALGDAGVPSDAGTDAGPTDAGPTDGGAPDGGDGGDGGP